MAGFRPEMMPAWTGVANTKVFGGSSVGPSESWGVEREEGLGASGSQMGEGGGFTVPFLTVPPSLLDCPPVGLKILQLLGLLTQDHLSLR